MRFVNYTIDFMKTEKQVQELNKISDNSVRRFLNMRIQFLIMLFSLFTAAVCCYLILGFLMFEFPYMVLSIEPIITLGLWIALVKVYDFNLKKMGWSGIIVITGLFLNSIFLFFCFFNNPR